MYVDVSVYLPSDYTPETPDIRPIVTLIIVGIIFGVISTILIIVLVKRKKKKREAGIQEVIKSKDYYCSNCGYANIDITSDYCSKCGSKIIR